MEGIKEFGQHALQHAVLYMRDRTIKSQLGLDSIFF